ncbi:hypothetical protein TTHERM_000672081 (macronuclear) [Tetrahymena thermophila SB210]|uniref:Uncharacterized protein n=1 Tax=Tetrahymena thermophila (strain SB210) TaxID=312017 RepID=W7XD74_TETTS|nr:hypothetical protein TTHERM_000672081 [Tetrahymena thermophila SB210]EWS74573.1 hypothetical protein TTHERM_000672081 [Tetrahymena thermophila SB210]|eukprot:XP_012652874.1 hypothetical protein TTHERM_000672081 [Tetrahymena thermophila SB210]
MSTDLQVFLPKFRNKQQYKCIIERSFNEAIEDATNNSQSPQNKFRQGLIDVVTPHKELDLFLAQDIIAIKPQSGTALQMRRINDIKSRVSSCYASRQISPSKIIDSSYTNNSLTSNQYFHKNKIYQNYKYKSVADDFDRNLLNNTCDIVKSQKVKNKIKDFQFQLYHKKHQPLFELSEENINFLAARDPIQFNFQQSQLQSEQQSIQKQEDHQEAFEQNFEPANQVLITETDESSKFLDKALIKTMKNSLDSFRFQNKRSKSELRGKATTLQSTIKTERNDLNNSINTINNELESSRNSINFKYKNNQPNQLLPPIFSLEQFSGNIDQLHSYAKMANKGKICTENFIQKGIPSSYPAVHVMSPKFTTSNSPSPSQKCKTESNYRTRSSSISGTNFIKKNDSNQRMMMITSPNVETEESTLKLDSLIQQQRVRNVQDISNKVQSQLEFNSNEIKQAMDSIRKHFWGSTIKDQHYIKLSQDQLFYEFLQFCQISHKVLEMHRQNLIQLPTDLKKNQLKLMDLIKETDKTILLEVMQEAFPVLKENINSIKQRILEALNFKLPKQIDKSTFYTIGWEGFQNFIQIAVTKKANLSEIANFIVKFFNPQQHKYIQVDDFISTLKTVSSKVDKYVDQKSKKTIFSAFEQNFKLLGIVVPGVSVFKSSQLRVIIMENKVNHNELIDLIFESF